MLAEEDDKRSYPLSGIVILFRALRRPRPNAGDSNNILRNIVYRPSTLATRYLSASDYGTYGLLMSIVALVGAAADGGASLLVPTHYGPASALERARLFASLAALAGMAPSSRPYP